MSSETLHSVPPAGLLPPIWVDRQTSFEKMVADLSAQSRVAVDTESNSLHAYREQVCLIQFSTPQTDYIIDPFVFEELSALGPLFANPRIEKIFHAAEYDLICLKRDFGFEFANLFDTMYAARVLGYQFVGLDNMLSEKLDIKVDKRHQKADWAARPLTSSQIDYARFDTHYLFHLRDILEQELVEKDRLQLAREDFARATKVEQPREKVNGSSWRRFSARKDVSQRELTILSELCNFRDQIAEHMDRPPFKVVDDDTLLAIVRNPPEKDVDLAAIGLTPKQIRLWGDEILAAVKRGNEAPLVEREHVRRPSDAMLRRLEKLKNWRKTRAKELGVESDVVLPKVYLNSLAENPPRGLEDLRSILVDSPWRYQQYGAQLLKLLGG
jgi:ribonuclease D